jgi:branched-chain amino acid transport system ATP-binding protein
MAFLNATEMLGGYGETTILNSCTISVNKGEIAVIVGPNGAGKSTAMRAIFGMLQLKKGRIIFDKQDITNLKPQERVGLGMGFVPQTNNVFNSMTVLENLEMGGFLNNKDIDKNIQDIFSLFPILHEKRSQTLNELSGGQRQQVAVGRALMTNPKLLMLDEPTAGVSPIVVKELFQKITEISSKGIAILMVEQNAKQALAIANKGFVLVQGENKYTDKGSSLLKNKEVRKAFLGG